MNPRLRVLWIALTLALLGVNLAVVEAHAADAPVTTMSVIDDNGRADKSVAMANYWRAGPDQITVSRNESYGDIGIQAVRGTSGYSDGASISIFPPWGKSLGEGTYTDAPDDYPNADQAKFSVSSSHCQYQYGRTTFTISDLAPDLSHFVLEYRTRCLTGEAGTFGMVRVNEPADSGLIFGTPRLAWPDRLVALSRSEVPVVLWNPGSAAVGITGIGFGGPDADEFFTEPLGPCAQIDAGASCVLTAGFRPTRAGDAQATLTVTEPGGSHSLPLVGTAVLNPATVSIAGDWQNSIVYHPRNFWEGHDSVKVGQRYGQVSVGVTPAGSDQYSGMDLRFQPPPGEQLHVGHYTVSGPYPGPAEPVMAISDRSGGGSCSTQGGEFDVLDLTPDRVWITFRARCSNGDGPSVFGEVRFGEAIASDVLTVPARLTWSAQQLGETNDPVPVTLVNLGQPALHVSGVRTTGPDAADFTAGPVGTCADVASGDGCNVSLVFQPAQLGARSATLVVDDSRGGHTVDLTGSGRPGPPLATTARPTNNHFPTCNVTMATTGPDSVAFSWQDECDPRQAYFFDYRAHYLIRGALGTVAPKVEADGFAVYSGHGRSASIAHLQPGQTYSFTLFTQHNDGGEVATDRTISPVRVSMNANLTGPAKGAELLVTGSVSTPNGLRLGRQPVELRAIYAGTTSAVTMATGQSDSNGDYEFRIVPTRPADYVVYFTGTGGYYFPGSSAPRFVPLTVRVALQAPARAVRYGKLATIKATVAPAQLNSPAQLQVYKSGKWRNLGTARCDAKGVLSFKVKLKDKGTYKYRVSWPGNGGTFAAQSRAVKIKVT